MGESQTKMTRAVIGLEGAWMDAAEHVGGPLQLVSFLIIFFFVFAICVMVLYYAPLRSRIYFLSSCAKSV